MDYKNQMNPITTFMILVSISTFIIGTPEIFLINSIAQPVVKDILIGPDHSKDGDDTCKADNMTNNKYGKVMWTNQDFGIHPGTKDQGLFGFENLRPDQIFEYTFETIGTYNYHFKLHTEMVGKIVVN